MRARITLPFVAVLSMACAAGAKDVRIGAVTIVLPVPSGYCELEQAQPSDARMIDGLRRALAGQNELLAISADCGQLNGWRAGTRPLLDDYVQVQTLISARDATIPRAEGIKQICAPLRTEGEKLFAGVTTDVKTRMETAFKDVKVNEMRFLGVLAEDASGCYFALLQKLRTEAGTDKTQVTVGTATIVKGKLVYYYSYAPYVNADTVTAMLTRHQSNVAALLAANGD